MSRRLDEKENFIQKPFYKKWWFWIIAIIVVLGVYGNVGKGSGQSVSKEHDIIGVVENSTEEKQKAATPENKEIQEDEAKEVVEEDTEVKEEGKSKEKTEVKEEVQAKEKTENKEKKKKSKDKNKSEEQEQSQEKEKSIVEEVVATMGQKNALARANDYLAFCAFSAKGLKAQLEFEGFSSEEAQYGIDNCGADWNEEAAKKAQDYLDFQSFSKSGLIDQLEFEGFTTEQAEYGVKAVGF